MNGLVQRMQVMVMGLGIHGFGTGPHSHGSGGRKTVMMAAQETQAGVGPRRSGGCRRSISIRAAHNMTGECWQIVLRPARAIQDPSWNEQMIVHDGNAWRSAARTNRVSASETSPLSGSPGRSTWRVAPGGPGTAGYQRGPGHRPRSRTPAHRGCQRSGTGCRRGAAPPTGPGRSR